MEQIYFHQQMRKEWGIGDQDSTEVRKLFKGHYRGRRYAFGYPACPNLDDQTGLFKLIEPLLLILVAGFVGFIVVALFLPLMEIMSQVGNF